MINERDKKIIPEKHCLQCEQDESYFPPLRTFKVFYPGEIHHLDGDPNNTMRNNLAMVCPNCNAHILMSRFLPEDIWLLVARGLSYAKIGRLLGISRERVRQLANKHRENLKSEQYLSEAKINELVKGVQFLEDRLFYSGRLNKRLDRRTIKKRIRTELGKWASKEVDSEGTY